MTASRAALLALVVVLSTLAGVAPASTSASATGGSCGTKVVHDAFRMHNQTMEQLANGKETTTRKDHTRVTVRPTDAFYRLKAENPNGYCVHVVVEIGEEALPPANLPSDVTSNDGNVTASWTSHHDYKRGQTFTRIAFDLPPGSTAHFAPSRYQVVGIAWASERQKKAEGTIAELKRKLNQPSLTQRKYQLEVGSAPASRTIRLQDPNSSAQIESYLAQYSTDGGQTWYPVNTDSDAPVYKSEGDGKVTFYWTAGNADAVVRFTANPTAVDQAKYETESWMSGVESIFDTSPDDSGSSGDGDGLFGGLFG
jgi:hypothetical protein